MLVRKYLSRGNKQSRLNRAMQSAVPELLEHRRLLSGTPIILDNTSAGVTVTGAWTYKSGIAGAFNGDYLHDQATGKGSKSVQYTPTLPAGGQYQVFGWWNATSIRPTNVPFDVITPSGTTTVLENQQINGGQWNLLGTYNFSAGTTGSVNIRNGGTAAATYVSADAVEFVPVATATTTVSVVTPAAGSNFNAGSNITVSAKAVPAVGTTISKVDFFQGTTLIGTSTAVDGNGNYTVTWSNVPANNYSITAKATDNTTTTFTSPPIAITVSAATGELPFPGPNAFVVPGQLEAENYDKGGEGVAYHDLDAANQGGAYRTTEGVDVEPTTDLGGGFNVGHIRASEWMQYTINVPTAGNYIFSTRVASLSGGTFHFSDGAVSTGPITLPNTGGWQTWQTVVSSPVTLPAGQQIVRLSFDTAVVSGGDLGNLNWFQITAAASSPPVVSLTAPTNGQTFLSGSTITLTANASENGGTIKSVDFYQGTTKLGTSTTSPYSFPWTNVPTGNYNLSAIATDTNGVTAASGVVSITINPSVVEGPFGGTPISVPGNLIPAVNYDVGGEGLAYHDVDAANNGGANYRPGDGVDIQTSTDPGTSFNVDHISAGEYLKYTINVTATGNYDIATRLSVANAGGQFHYEVDGVNVTGTIGARYTLGYTSWETVSTGNFAMTAGTHVLKLMWDSSMDGNEIADLASIKITPAFTSTPWPTTWSSGTAAPSARFESVGHLLNGKIYEIGGFRNAQFQVSNEIDAYDVASNTWQVLNNIPAGIAQTHQGVTDDGTFIYFAGGFSGDLMSGVSPSQPGTNAVWQFNPTTQVWVQMPSLPDIRGAAPMVYLNGKLHYFGGNPADRVTNLGTHYVFDLAAWKANPASVTGWTLAAPMPNPRDHSSAVVLNGLIYSIGGEHGHDALHQQQADNWSYSDVTNTWTQLASMPIAKSHTEGGTFVYNGRIIWATGQVDNFGSTTNVVEYDPGTNSWQLLPPMPVPREGATVQVFNNEVLEIDGGVSTNAPSNTVYIGIIPAAGPSAAPAAAISGAFSTSSIAFPAEQTATTHATLSGAVVGKYEYFLADDGSVMQQALGSDFAGVYSPASKRPFAADGVTLQALNNKLYLFGGYGKAAGKTAIFDIASKKWHMGANVPFAVSLSGSTVLDNNIYVAGGLTPDGKASNGFAKYNPATNKWTSLGALPIAGAAPTVASDGKGSVFISYAQSVNASGILQNVEDNTLQSYDTTTKLWAVWGAPGGPPHPPGCSCPACRALMQAAIAAAKAMAKPVTLTHSASKKSSAV